MEIYRQEQRTDFAVEINRTCILGVNTTGDCGCQFIKPVSGFECSICKIFLRSEDHIEEHFSSFQHVTIYQIHLRSHVVHQNGTSLRKDDVNGHHTGGHFATGENYDVRDCDGARADFDSNLSGELKREDTSQTPYVGLSFIAVESCAAATSSRDQNWSQTIDSEDIKSHSINETSDANSSFETNSSLQTSTDNVTVDPELDSSELDLHLSPNSDKCSDIHVQDKRYRDGDHANKMLYSCDACGKFCRSRIHLSMHQETHQEQQLPENESKPFREKSFVCVTCGKAFTSNAGLVQHKRVHSGERPYVCDVCSKSFKSRQYLYVHKRIHTGEKPYSCDVCGKAFNQSSSLTTHKRIHTGEQPFSCDLCDRTFNQSSSLKTHKWMHAKHDRTHTRENSYICDTSGKAFTHNLALAQHKPAHTGERPYACDVCGKSFKSRQYLYVHKRIHTGEKPYSCDICGKAFNQSSTLTAHKRIHTGEQPFSCDLCDKSFNQSSTLKTHKQTHTKQNRTCATEKP